MSFSYVFGSGGETEALNPRRIRKLVLFFRSNLTLNTAQFWCFAQIRSVWWVRCVTCVFNSPASTPLFLGELFRLSFCFFLINQSESIHISDLALHCGSGSGLIWKDQIFVFWVLNKNLMSHYSRKSDLCHFSLWMQSRRFWSHWLL